MTHPIRFDPESIATFRIVDRDYDPSSRTVSLRYGFDDQYVFEETVTFETEPRSGTEPRPVGSENRSGFDRALLHLHIASGTSYYKAAAPSTIEVEGDHLSVFEREFHRRLYDDGLREFAVANGLPIPRAVEIRATPANPGPHDRCPTTPNFASRATPRATPTPPPPPATPPPPPPPPTPPPPPPPKEPPEHPEHPGLLVPIGGGKDSMVLIEALKDLSPTLFAVNPHPLVIELASRTGLELIVVRRTLSPELARLNRAGALNGHVPITAIVSLIAVLGSFLYGYDSIVMAIEASASEETRLIDGVAVNHQFSKSLEFEQLLQRLIREAVLPGLTYGSALRPYSELAIARAFSGLVSYHDAFCSCNAAFRQQAAAGDRWCGKCPKCRFVGLMLAPFVEPEVLTAIIGRDLFSDPGQVEGFAALMSDEDKPFECVGERRESAAALRVLTERPGWKDSVVVNALSGQARSSTSEADVARLLTPDLDHQFPDSAVAAAVERLMAVDHVPQRRNG